MSQPSTSTTRCWGIEPSTHSPTGTRWSSPWAPVTTIVVEGVVQRKCLALFPCNVVLVCKENGTWKNVKSTTPPPKIVKERTKSLTHSVLLNEALVPRGCAHAAHRIGPHSANSTLVVLENTAKLKLVSKWTSFWWRERTSSLPIALFWCSNRQKYNG